MQVRLENWIEGLHGDWNITRQRFFGVPFPIWYPVGADGEVDWNSPIMPDARGVARRPVDRHAAGLHRDPAQPAGRFHRRSRRHGHVGDVVDEPGVRVGLGARRRLVPARVPDGSAPAGARHHPDVALLHNRARRDGVRHAAVHERRRSRASSTDPERKKMSKSKSNAKTNPFVLIGEPRRRRDPLLGRRLAAGPRRDSSIPTSSRSAGASR